jgi:tetratricopeptide (TPR) repeat protein
VALHYRGRALFELARFEEAYRDLKSASDQLRRDDVKYGFEDLDVVTNLPGAREAKRGDLLSLAANAAQHLGDVQKAADALADARSAYGAAISKAPNVRAWQESLAILP